MSSALDPPSTRASESDLSTISNIAPTQRALVLKGPKQRYELVNDWNTPKIERDDEILVKVDVIGLNPIDWKAPDFGFGIPALPCVNGRDLAGTVVQVGREVTRVKVGDRVWGPSTNYRDFRTSTFQEYAISTQTSVGIIPPNLSSEQAAGIGVGITTAALALGSALGIKIHGFDPRSVAIGAEGEEEDWVERNEKRRGSKESVTSADSGYSSTSNGEQVDELLSGLTSIDHQLRKLDLAPSGSRSEDEGEEGLEDDHEGKWILIWGGSCVTGFFAIQLAKLAGMKVIAVANREKHGQKLSEIGTDHVVDREDPENAVREVKRLTGGNLRYAVDCIGKTTAELASQTLDQTRSSFLVGLTGLPKELPPNVQGRSVPVKTFHTNPSVGLGLTHVITDLLATGRLVLPPVTVSEGGLEGINSALDKLRKGSVSCGRLVVRVGDAVVVADGVGSQKAAGVV